MHDIYSLKNQDARRKDPVVAPAFHTLRAGARNVRWEVLIYPGSSLKAGD
jgi:hypothetical protein